MYIHKNILVSSNIDYVWSKKNREPIQNLETIVIHYTAGASPLSSVRYLTTANTPTSAHLLIGRDGKIYQMVDFETQAWHCGKSQLLGNTNMNAFSVGIELDNAGLLKEHDNRYYAWFGKKIPESQVIQLINPQTGFHAYWQTYTEIQLNMLKEVCKLLLFHYKIRRIVGHNEISLSGKIDPGPAFPMSDFKKLIYG
jgi:N-acetyl-anhydromuramyl-L-alanine amidase AmpD